MGMLCRGSQVINDGEHRTGRGTKCPNALGWTVGAAFQPEVGADPYGRLVRWLPPVEAEPPDAVTVCVGLRCPAADTT